MIILLVLSILLLNSTFSMLTTLLPLLIYQVDNSTSQVELVLMTFMISLLITRIILFLKTYSFKQFLIVGSVSYSVAFLILTLADKIFMFYIGAAFFGLSFAILAPLLLTYLSRTLKNATTVYNLLIAFSAAISPLIGEIVYFSYGRWISVIWLFISFVCLILNFYIALKSSNIESEAKDNHGITKHTISAFKEILISLLLISIPYGAIITYLPLYLSKTNYSIGMFYSLFWLSYAGASYTIGRFINVFFKDRIKIISIILMIFSVLSLVFADSMIGTYIAAVLFGLGFGSVFNIFYGEVAEIKNDYEKNNGYAIIGLMSYLGVGIAPVLLSSFSDNLSHTFLVSISFLVFAIFYNSGIIRYRIRRKG